MEILRRSCDCELCPLPVMVIADMVGIAFARRIAGRPPMSSILASYDCQE